MRDIVRDKDEHMRDIVRNQDGRMRDIVYGTKTNVEIW